MIKRSGNYRGALTAFSQAGFSLIELMVAITIALFLIAGLAGIVSSMRQSFTIQDRLTQMQENARFLLTVFNTTVHNAGYFPDPVGSTVLTALPATTVANTDGTKFSAGQAVSGTTGASSDTLNVRFQTASGDGLMTCQGDKNTSGAAVTWTNSFAVNAAKQLTCAVSINGAAPGAASIITDYVSAITILYGVDTNSDGSADTYMPSANVVSGNYWQSVYSVQITITFYDLVNSKTGTPVNLPKTLRHTINLMNKA